MGVEDDYEDEGTEIAIVGMAGRFPGADDVDALWRLVVEGRRGLRRLTDAELRADGVDPARPGLVPFGGPLTDIDLFDARFFGLSRREAELCDPQHRLMLEIAWQAFEDAARAPAEIEGPVGVYLGSALNTYGLRQLLEESVVATSTFQRFVGIDKDFLATRVAYKLGLTGPALSVQTACSTSLVAVGLACQHLLDHRVDFALAGGVTVGVPHHTGHIYEESGIFSSDGACRAFDAAADGTVPGNGVAAVVLRRLDDALADGDPIHAVIRGAAFNNDGAAKAGYTAPSVIGQARCIAEALVEAAVDPRTIGLVEAHGTGTQLGDPIELAALSRVWREATADRGFCALGSIKSNVGHLNAAAGVAGLIKAALALREATLPPSLHFERPNPKLELDASPFYVPTTARPWPAGAHPRRAAVSSFGFGGTNAHAVLEEVPTRARKAPADGPALLPISAHTPAALSETAARLADHLADRDIPLADVAATLQRGRAAMAHRRICVARDRDEAITRLRTDGPRVFAGRAGERPPPLVFLYSGQGAQYPGMARALYAEAPAFARHLDAFSAHVERVGGPALAPLLEGGDLEDTALAQPLMIGIELALTRLLAGWGLTPSAVAGHSLGEIAAAVVAGALDDADAARLVVARGAAMAATPAGGTMAVWRGREAVEALGLDAEIAADNGPDLCLLAGTDRALEAAAARLTAEGIRARRLPGRCAFHSRLMDGAVERLRAVGARLRPRAPRLPWICGVTGDWHPDDAPPPPDYWARHAREPVRFGPALEHLLGEAHAVIVEVGPGGALASLAARHPAHRGQPIVETLPGARERRGDRAVLLEAVGRAWVAGAPVDYAALGGDGARVRLPGVAFQRKRYWIEPSHSAAPPKPAAPLLDVNDLVDVL